MSATELLHAEHKVILGVLDGLEQLIGTTPFDRKLAARVVDFLASYADRHHHGKEEELLFPELAKRGLPRNSGPIACMHAEHDEGRAHVAGMRDGLSALAPGRPELFCKHAREFVTLLRSHISREDNVLFPLADRMLEGAPEIALQAEFERFESAHGAERERCLALARDVCAALGVEPAKIASREAP